MTIQNINLGELVNDIIAETKELDTIHSILGWFNQAKPNPTNQNVLQQTAYHFEEVAEMVEALSGEPATVILEVKDELLEASSSDEAIIAEYVQSLDKKALLDALCDQIVTALGVGYMMGFDMQGALAEVNRSNWSKFENDKPVINEQGKIIKGKDYTPPQLEPFINPSL